jgi:hypothetical protein
MEEKKKGAMKERYVGNESIACSEGKRPGESSLFPWLSASKNWQGQI